MILYLKNPKDFIKNLRSYKHSAKVAWYKINISKLAFLYTKNKHAEKEIGKTIPFIKASKH
jgi:hypothetical protein